MTRAPNLWPFGDRSRRAVPLKLRLLAWWEGFDVDDPAWPRSPRAGRQRARAEREFESLFDSVGKDGNAWSDERKEVVQALWTRGFIVPGGMEYACELVNGCGLSAAETLLEIGVGFGGSTRAVINRYRNYVLCYERDAALVEEARRQATAHGCDDKLQIVEHDLETLKLKRAYYRAALLREVLYTVEGKAALLDKVVAALKPGESQLVIADFMFDGASTPAFDQWRDFEPHPMYPCSLEQLTRELAKRAVVVRTADDESARYRRMVVEAWKRYLASIDTESLPTLIGRQVVHEAEFWTRRLGAIEAGVARYVRVVGIKNS